MSDVKRLQKDFSKLLTISPKLFLNTKKKSSHDNEWKRIFMLGLNELGLCSLNALSHVDINIRLGPTAM